MLRKILARKLLNYSTDQLWDLLTGQFVLVFDDGEIITNARESLYSAYSWRFHKEYPLTPLLIRHHVQHTLNGGKLGSKTHLRLLGEVMHSVHDYYVTPENGVELRDILGRMVYQLTNEMYSDLSYRVEAFVVSIDILDFIEIRKDPDTAKVLENLSPDQSGIDAAYSALTKVLNSKTALPFNRVIKAVQAGLVDKNQVLQCLGPRGYLTDIDSNQFRDPIMRGYLEGVRSIVDSLKESRSSAKSLFFSKTPLEDAEYFSRRLQLLCQVVKTLHPGDCGSQHYLTWHVRPPTYDDGIMTFKGDLGYIEGKYYLDEESNTLKIVRKTDKHLHDKTIKMRSVVAGCMHPDTHGLCSVCFGELSYSVPDNTNIGHMCATSMTEKSSQSVLSVKHSDGSVSIIGMVLPQELKGYMDTTPDQMSYILPMCLKGKDVQLIVKQAEAEGLTDIALVNDTNDLNITRVSGIDIVGVVVMSTDLSTGEITKDAQAIPVSLQKRLASFTYPMLTYIKQNGYEVDDRGNVVINMKSWDFEKPIMTLPMKHFNMGDHSEDIAKIIESRVDDLTERDTDLSPAAILFELYDLVNSKLNVNLAVLEVIVYAAMTQSARENNFDLPKPWTTKGLGVSSSTIAGRSLSAAMGYQRHRDIIVNPASFFGDNRPSHPMDVFLMPAETVADM